jgi:hypothetical protein
VDEKKSLIITVGTSTAAAVGLGALLYMQGNSIAERRAEAERISGEIAQNRALIATTPEVESQVILMRETDEVISSILPDDEDVNDFARALSGFGKLAGVNITQLRDKVAPATRSKTKEDFRKVGYSINFEADAFQMLSMLDLVESHERFMQVPSFRLTAASRTAGEQMLEAPLHKVEMEIETFVYEPQKGVKPVGIDNYERKAELLAGEVAERRRELEIPSYDFEGPRNRRDPWVDPRVPMLGEGGDVPIPIPEQLQLVEELEALGDRAEELWQRFDGAPHLIAEMQARRDLEQHMTDLELECETLENDRIFSYFPAQRRFEGVRERLAGIRERLQVEDQDVVKFEVLRGTIEIIQTHMEQRNFDRAWEAYQNIEGRLPVALRDPLRRPLARKIEELGTKIERVLEFQQLDLAVEGYVDLGPGRRVVLIDGRTYAPPEIVAEHLILEGVGESQVDFVYKGVRMTLPIETPVAVADGDRKAGGRSGR